MLTFNFLLLKDIGIIIMIVFFIMISYLIIINIRTLKRVIKLQKGEEQNKIDDARYHELNNKIQLLIVVSSIIISIGVFLGISTYESIIKMYSTNIEKYEKIIERLSLEGQNANELYNTSNKSLIKTKRESDSTLRILRQLEKDYRLNAKTYFVKGININQQLNDIKSKNQRIYFKDLKKFNKKIPDIFREEPFVTVVGMGTDIVSILNITKEYFEFESSGTIELEDGVLLDEFKKLKPISPEEKNIYNSLISMMNNSFKQYKNINKYKETISFDIIIIEGISN